MDFDGPAPFVAADEGGTTSGDALTIRITTHHRLPQHDRTTKRCKRSFPAPNSNNLAIATNVPDIFSNKYSFALKTTLL
jgi:hypothetical protein